MLLWPLLSRPACLGLDAAGYFGSQGWAPGCGQLGQRGPLSTWSLIPSGQWVMFPWWSECSHSKRERPSTQVPLPTASHTGKGRFKRWRNRFLLLEELLSHIAKAPTNREEFTTMWLQPTIIIIISLKKKNILPKKVRVKVPPM